ncbi:sugar phosphate isomerase [Photobacterium rosenbergii]|uniref:Sugar phosphate isomerase n=1 Tax=Photobacterium rosenbergii TaxID=294936 RepID=A0A2T3NJM9_9GAMM|nr:sugar phosphate isomerase/epimerase [Photobacterium rosenbergii]PSW15673.1 sugar phosphate isomerase [Photobacterium rosenbergii]
MAKPKIAVQMILLKEKIAEIGVYKTLKQMTNLGYKSVEVSQLDMTEENVSELERAKNELGVEICALTVGCSMKPYGGVKLPFAMEILEDGFDKIISDAKRLDCQFLRIGMLPFSYMSNAEGCLEYAKEMNMYGKRLKEMYGMKLFFHNHHAEFEKVTDDGKTIMDILIENTDPDYVGFELDVHWVHRAGENPVEWIKKLKGRVELVHLKDYKIEVPKEMPKDTRQFYDTYLHKLVRFAEVGEGTLNFKEIISACEEADVRYLPIEQDETYGKDPMDCLKTSAHNLNKMGYADYF